MISHTRKDTFKGKEIRKKRKMGNIYQRVKRGMVFWYNIDESVNKKSNPTIEVNGKTYTDHIQYGKRMYLVVSNDNNNVASPLCNIVPMSSQQDKAKIPTHVGIRYQNTDLVIMCEQVHTVNSIALTEYCFTLTDMVMDKVDAALAVQLNLKCKPKYLDGVEASLVRIEEIIEKIIQDKVAQYKPKQANTVDIEDAVIRLGEGLESLLGLSNTQVTSEPRRADESVITVEVPSANISKETPVERNLVITEFSDVKVEPVIDEKKPEEVSEKKEQDIETGKVQSKSQTIPKKENPGTQSQVDKFYKRYPNLSPKETNIDKEKKKPVKNVSKKSKRNWTEDTMKEFLADTESMSPTDAAKKWEFDTVKRMFQMKYYVRNKLAGLSK